MFKFLEVGIKNRELGLLHLQYYKLSHRKQSMKEYTISMLIVGFKGCGKKFADVFGDYPKEALVFLQDY